VICYSSHQAQGLARERGKPAWPFKVSHAERENITRVTTLDVPKDFLDLMNAENSPTSRQTLPSKIVIEGDIRRKWAVLQWAKFWGMSLPEGERLSVFKLATKKGGSDKVARLQLKPFDPNGVQRGREAEHQGNSGNSGSSYH